MTILASVFLLAFLGAALSPFLTGLPLSCTSSAVAGAMGNGGGTGGRGEAPDPPPGWAA